MSHLLRKFSKPPTIDPHRLQDGLDHLELCEMASNNHTRQQQETERFIVLQISPSLQQQEEETPLVAAATAVEDDEDLDATIPVATATAVTPAGGAARRQATASSQQETRCRSGNTDSKLMALDPLAQTIQREAASSRMDTFVQEIGKFCGKEAWDMRAKYCFIASENLPWNLPDAWWDDLVL